MSTNLKKVADVDFNAMEEVCANEVFPEVFQPGQAKIKRRIHRHRDCQASNPDYIPDERLLRRVLGWWFAPRLKSLGLHGETGTGKTELLLYIADRLNEPVYLSKIHQALMPEDLEGSKELVAHENGAITRNSLGLAARAFKNGGLLILDEMDKANAPLGCALHGLVEGKPWPIEQFGIVLNAHPYFRCAGTANTTGEGGHERYHTSNRMDQALRSRFGWLECKFPETDVETKIIQRKFPKLPFPLVRDMIGLANGFRDALLGPMRDGNIDEPINAVFSTRTLVQWCNYLMAFSQDAYLKESLSFALDGGVDPEFKGQAKDIIQRHFGDRIEMKVGDLLKEVYGKK